MYSERAIYSAIVAIKWTADAL